MHPGFNMAWGGGGGGGGKEFSCVEQLNLLNELSKVEVNV